MILASLSFLPPWQQHGYGTSAIRRTRAIDRGLLLLRHLQILHTSQMQAYMVAHNSHVPINLIYLAILTQIVPPALVLLGYKTRYGALALAGFCIIATSLFHAEFGNHAEVEQFLLDFALAGGLLFMFACGPGPLSFDERERR